jgi:hypothetical protein
MKTNKIIFWITTIIIVLFEGLMPALFSQTELAKEGIKHLGYPQYFGNALVVFKILGTLVLIIPKLHKTIKEWAYVGFSFVFLFAAINHTAIDGFTLNSLLPIIALGILVLSYINYHKINTITN